MSEPRHLRTAAAQFQFRGEAEAFVPYGNGHINDTYLVTCNGAAAPARYILQRINSQVFHSPAVVMQNIERVTAHLAAQLARTGSRSPRAHAGSSAGRQQLVCRRGRRNLARLSLH